MGELTIENMREKIDRLEEEIRRLRAKMVEQNRLEEHLIQAQKMESLANLSAGIAHDFNNILQSILGYTQIALINKSPDDPDYELFSQIENMIQKGSQLTKQFLTFGRKIEPKFKPLNLNHKIRRTLNILLGNDMPPFLGNKEYIGLDYVLLG